MLIAMENDETEIEDINQKKHLTVSKRQLKI